MGEPGDVDVPRDLEDVFVLDRNLLLFSIGQAGRVLALLVVGEEALRNLVVVAAENDQERDHGRRHHLSVEGDQSVCDGIECSRGTETNHEPLACERVDKELPAPIANAHGVLFGLVDAVERAQVDILCPAGQILS